MLNVTPMRNQPINQRKVSANNRSVNFSGEIKMTTGDLASQTLKGAVTAVVFAATGPLGAIATYLGLDAAGEGMRVVKNGITDNMFNCTHKDINPFNLVSQARRLYNKARGKRHCMGRYYG